MRSVFLTFTRTALPGVCSLLFLGAMSMSAQAPMAPMGQPPAANGGGQNKQLTDQIAELRAQVAKLQAAQQQGGMAKKPMAVGMGMGMGMGEMGGMKPGMKPGMKDDQGEMAGMSAGGAAPMPAPAKAMGMCCMGEMGMPPAGGASMVGNASGKGMAGMRGSSAMPGQPGASHLLHMGSTGFFLDHSQHITLSPDQKSRLNRLKEKAMLEQASEQRKIDQLEQELYTVTGADQPDNSKIQAKIGEIEKVRGEQRMNFIRAVGEASNVLNHDQHQALLGTMPAGTK